MVSILVLRVRFYLLKTFIHTYGDSLVEELKMARPMMMHCVASS